MSYIGNAPISAAFLVDTFSGNGSTVAFTMTVAPANTSSILVSVTGVLQSPDTYSVSGTTLTFSAAPPSGTSNISVRYLGIPASGVTTTAYRTVTNFTATAGQTSFSVPSYTVGYIDVYRNGVRLVSTDYTATTGTTVVLNNACTVGDSVVTESFLVSSVLNAIPATAGSINSSYLASGVARANWGAGGILQVVQGSLLGGVSTTSSTAVATGLTVTITPTFATSKILVSVIANGVQKNSGNANAGVILNVYKNGSNLQRIGEYIGYTATSLTNDIGTAGIDYLDSPATTSATTYALFLSSNVSGQQVYINAGGDYSTITLMEIAA